MRAVAADFGDLPVELATDLADGAVLSPETTVAVADAVRTLLHNVRRHAQATAVTIHADLVDNQWELTLRDDGVGFDPARTPPGFGLHQLVTANLTAHGVTVDLDSTPGVGTAAVLRGTSTRSACDPR